MLIFWRVPSSDQQLEIYRTWNSDRDLGTGYRRGQRKVNRVRETHRHMG